jgi:hypothetical protein
MKSGGDNLSIKSLLLKPEMSGVIPLTLLSCFGALPPTEILELHLRDTIM